MLNLDTLHTARLTRNRPIPNVSNGPAGCMRRGQGNHSHGRGW